MSIFRVWRCLFVHTPLGYSYLMWLFLSYFLLCINWWLFAHCSSSLRSWCLHLLTCWLFNLKKILVSNLCFHNKTRDCFVYLLSQIKPCKSWFQFFLFHVPALPFPRAAGVSAGNNKGCWERNQDKQKGLLTESKRRWGWMLWLW